MKMTFQPKKRQRAKVHGFRARMKTAGGRKVIAARRAKGRAKLNRLSKLQATFPCGLFLLRSAGSGDLADPVNIVTGGSNEAISFH